MKKYYEIRAAIIAFVFLTCLFFTHTPNFEKSLTKSSTPADAPPIAPLSSQEKIASVLRGSRSDLIKNVFSAPITFYGKVIDQHGAPVNDANISFSANTALDSFHDNASSTFITKSDFNGEFSISGIHGAALTVYVAKDGYYEYKDKSNASFGYGIGPDSSRQSPPSKQDPAIFILWKKSQLEPMIEHSWSVKLKADGMPVALDLRNKTKLKSADAGDVSVELWSQNISLLDMNHNGKRYSWKCILSVPGGGIMKRTNQYETMAPNAGYQQSLEFDFPTTKESWKSSEGGDYFFRLVDGCYGRTTFRAVPDGGNNPFVRLEYHLNMKPLSRNLDTKDPLPYDNY